MIDPWIGKWTVRFSGGPWDGREKMYDGFPRGVGICGHTTDPETRARADVEYRYENISEEARTVDAVFERQGRWVTLDERLAWVMQMAWEVGT